MSDPRARIRVGTSGWTYAHWKGPFYPEDLPKSRWLEFYAGNFETVEINATFYGTFKDTTYQSWRARAPQGFQYVLKAPRLITHRKYLQDVTEDIRQFTRSAGLLEEKLGGFLLQIAPDMPYDPGRLKTVLQAFEDASRVAVEFRRQEWLNDEVRGLLAESGAAFCSVDSPQTRPLEWATGKMAYLRLHGRKRWHAYDYTQEELREIAALARKMADSGAESVYVFFNNDFEGRAPRNARVLTEMLREDGT